jgi:hypothetical protein
MWISVLGSMTKIADAHMANGEASGFEGHEMVVEGYSPPARVESEAAA